jgi:hypothetical protein
VPWSGGGGLAAAPAEGAATPMSAVVHAAAAMSLRVMARR